MTLLVGPSGSTIVDGTHDERTVDDALRALVVRAGGTNAWVVLGAVDGDADEHDRIGRLVAQLGIYHLVVVGSAVRVVHAAARSEGLRPEEAVFAANADEAIAYLRENLQPAAVVLVRGAVLAAVVGALTGAARP